MPAGSEADREEERACGQEPCNNRSTDAEHPSAGSFYVLEHEEAALHLKEQILAIVLGTHPAR